MFGHTHIHTIPLTAVAHQLWTKAVSPGDVVLDATAGNGHDTVFLSQLCGTDGRVIAIDIQAEALEQARARIVSSGSGEHVLLLHGDHARLGELVDRYTPSGFSLVVFNLGYLPGGRKQITTTVSGTVKALEQAYERLRPGGHLSVMCYPGHDEGLRETVAVEQWVYSLSNPSFEWHRAPLERERAPRLLFLQR